MTALRKLFNFGRAIGCRSTFADGIEDVKTQGRLPFGYKQLSPKSNTTKTKKDIKLVIFDKDGTLVCFHTLWAPWSREFAARLNNATGLQIEEKIYQNIGFCPETEKVLPGTLAEATTAKMKDELVVLLTSHGIAEANARQVLSDIWTEGNNKNHIKPLGDAKTIFKTLKENKIKVAVCTSDNRVGSEAVLAALDVQQYLDMLICGDDPHSVPKPAPENALRICRELNVHPSNTAMIGDTKTDMIMSKSAGLGLTIGVVSGVGSHGDLVNTGADYVVDNIDHVLKLIMPCGFYSEDQS